MLTFMLLDFEATDKEPKLARPIQIATHHLNQDLTEISPLKESLIYAADYPEVSKEIEELTGVSDAEVKANGRPFVESYEVIKQANPDFIIAHNKGYDRTVFDMECDRQGLKRLDIAWICSWQDYRWPEKFRCKKLSHLALDHGVMVDPKTLHRASGDVIILLQLIKAASIDLVAFAKYAMLPSITIQALVPVPWKDKGAGKDRAKACGFGWQQAPGTDGPTYNQSWVKRIKENELQFEKEKLGYGIKIL